MSRPELPTSSEAERLFEAHLAELASGEAADVESLCARRPELAEELRRLAARWTLVEGVVARLGPPSVSEPSAGSATGAPPEPPFARDVWSRLGPRAPHYEVRGLLGEGGMGRVLEVFDHGLGRTLAMKVLREPARARGAAGDTRALARFLDEARVTGQLEHPAIVPVHELGADEEHGPYYTMRLVRGQNLLEVARRVHAGDAEWSLERALAAMERVCEAVAYAHSRGVVHRDLKPANVLLGDFGEVYVVDWGLARVLDAPELPGSRERPAVRSERRALAEETPLTPLVTGEGDALGTPNYMAPEQARGSLAELGAAADVYSLGATLYHLVAGHAPYAPPGSSSTPAQLVELVKRGPPEPLARAAPQAPPELCAVVERAMATDRALRYASAEELAADLRAYLEGRVVRAFEQGAWAELKKWVRRNPWPTAAAGLGLALLAAGFAAVELGRLARREQGLRYANEVAASAMRLANGQDYEAVRQLLEEPRSSPSGWELDFLRAWAEPPLRDPRSGVRLLLSSPGAGWTASITDSGKLRTEGSQGERLAEAELPFDRVSAAALSADAAWMALAGEDGSLAFLPIDAANGRLTDSARLVHRESAVAVASLAFVGDEALLLVGREDGTAELWNAEGRLVSSWRAHSNRLVSVAASADGGVLATAGVARILGEVAFWDARSGDPPVLLRRSKLDPGEKPRALAALEGSLFAAGTSGGSWLELDARSDRDPIVRARLGSELRQLEASEGRLLGATADGRLLLFGRFGGIEAVLLSRREGFDSVVPAPAADLYLARGANGDVWRVDPRLDRGTRLFEGHLATAYCVAFRPGSALLASGSADRTVRLWSADTGLALATLHGHGDRVMDLAWTPDGSRLVSVSVDRSAIVWDWERLELVKRVDLGSSDALGVVVHPTGERAFTCSLDGALRAFELAGDEPAVELARAESPAAGIALSPDGEWIATVHADGTLRLWSARDGSARGSRRVSEAALTCVAFQPTGERIAVGSELGDVLLLRGSDLALERSWNGHQRAVRGLAFDASGERLASAGEDQGMCIWDLESSVELLGLRTHAAALEGLAFSSDGERIATAGADRVVRVWDGAPNAEALFEGAVERAREHSSRPAVEALHERLAPSQVARAIREDPTLTEEERARRLRLAAVDVPDPARLANRAWRRACTPDATDADLEQAAQMAREAYERAPRTPACRLALAMGLVRIGRVDEALSLLPERPAPDKDPRFEETLGFEYVRALAEAQQGRLDDARAARARYERFVARWKAMPEHEVAGGWIETASRELEALLADPRGPHAHGD